MSKQRFLFLLRHLCFDTKETRIERKAIDKLSPIRDVFEIFNENCNKAYTISEFATSDEKLEAFGGRCAFKQYMHNKPNKYGIKIFALVDAEVFYTQKLEVYVGKQPEGPYCVKNDVSSIVERLIAPISGTNRKALFEKIRKNYLLSLYLRKPVHLYLVSLDSRKTLQLYRMYHEKEKNIILASSMHYDDAIDASTGNKNKPEIISFYNSTKGDM
ncbi:hypothetical protein CBL_05120 [Carabus blaptoides fortunei]